MCNDFHSSGASHAIIPPSNDLEISSLPATQKHLATKRRIGSPQASGRTEVFVFSSAIETPPATYRFRNAGARPHENSLTADVSALVKTNDSARTHCCKRKGLYPNKPAAEPGPKENKALRTTSSVKRGTS